MIIPYEQLDKDTLYNLIESYVLREGTDYGAQEYSLNDKVAQVRKQLEIGEVKINFDACNQSCQIVSAID